MEIVGTFDGLIRARAPGEPQNPGGLGCYGWDLTVDGVQVAQGYGYLGWGDGMTVNVAEYGGLITLLQKVRELGYAGHKITITGDSQVIVRQVLGQYRCTVRHLELLRDTAQRLIWSDLDDQVDLVWVRREENKEADRLSQVAFHRAKANPDTPFGTTIERIEE